MGGGGGWMEVVDGWRWWMGRGGGWMEIVDGGSGG